MENRVGRLDSVIKILGDGNIDIKGISLADTENFGIVRLIVDDIEGASALLKSKGFLCKINEVTVVSVDNAPGGLAKILGILFNSSINIEYMYAIAAPAGDRPLMVFGFGDRAKAGEVLAAAKVDILDEARLLASTK
ncbi:MAG: hypothetical protein J6866_00075 [Victivallales bacterium]|nr:hypothetical protein [Victivallales bacterium]